MQRKSLERRVEELDHRLDEKIKTELLIAFEIPDYSQHSELKTHRGTIVAGERISAKQLENLSSLTDKKIRNLLDALDIPYETIGKIKYFDSQTAMMLANWPKDNQFYTPVDIKQICSLPEELVKKMGFNSNDGTYSGYDFLPLFELGFGLKHGRMDGISIKKPANIIEMGKVDDLFYKLKENDYIGCAFFRPRDITLFYIPTSFSADGLRNDYIGKAFVRLFAEFSRTDPNAIIAHYHLGRNQIGAIMTAQQRTLKDFLELHYVRIDASNLGNERLLTQQGSMNVEKAVNYLGNQDSDPKSVKGFGQENPFRSLLLETLKLR